MCKNIFNTIFLFLCFFLIPFQAFSYLCQDSFSAGSVFVKFVQEHIGENWVDEMGAKWEQKIIRSTNHWNKKSAEDFLNYLQKRIGIKDTIERIKSPSYFRGMSYQSFINRISLYEEYMDESKVTICLRKSLGGFYTGDVNEIRLVIEYVKNYTENDSIENLMEKDLLGFSRAKLLQLQEVVKYVEKHIGVEATKELMEKDLRAFSIAKLSGLKAMVQYLRSYIKMKATKNLMKRSLRALSVAKLSKLKKIVQYIESHIGVKLTKKKIETDLHSLSKLTLEKLNQWKEASGSEAFKDLLEQYSFRYLLELYD